MPVIVSKDAISINYEESGSGLPLVFIHGWAMSGKVWSFQKSLAEQFRLITVDLRGHGQSSSSETFSLKTLMCDLSLLFEHLDLKSAFVVGWSLGSQVALYGFRELKDRISALVLVGGTPRFTANEDYSAGLPFREVRGLQVRLMRDYERAMGEFFRRMFAPGELSRERENRIAREIIMGGRLPDPAVALQGLEILTNEDLRGLLPAVDRPVLVIHGEEDSVCPVPAAYFLAKELPDSRLRIFPGVGHAPFLSRPETFNEAIAAFVREVQGAD
ncbi:alpha/beta fold hydrolase [Geobacter sp. DSM 9736]|uniref:alpha/beta fold hydrolase n=1 Tax=Geobacter sp. DSM 9736 TaxID=1277350 RepID=UPI000B50787C|nr:alpha/beta fold hydrolase [Geobacter sp. DSM 9736]SNB46431.1 pimeloyl-[acyl-carrier protein] methyl ester esterase [Geobacter sp. DSM 9736]